MRWHGLVSFFGNQLLPKLDHSKRCAVCIKLRKVDKKLQRLTKIEENLRKLEKNCENR